MDWGRVVQAGLGEAFGIMNFTVRTPRFPAASRWAGDVAETCGVCAKWVGLPLGPLRLPLAWLMMRRTRAVLASMPIERKLVVAGVGAFVAGLGEALEQFLVSKKGA